jgi:HTH-type transcriptional regulator/antitoxin HigA
MEEKKELLKELKGIKKIENEEQYNQMVARVEQLLPFVDDDTPEDNPNRIELEMLSNLVADYSDDHFDINREF